MLGLFPFFAGTLQIVRREILVVGAMMVLAFGLVLGVVSDSGASIGTSAPELAVDLTALARGTPAIALGDAAGSSLVDATLSIGTGPLVAGGADVTRSTAIVSTSYARAAIGVGTAMLILRNRLERRVGAGLILLYAAAYAVVLGFN